MKQIWNKILLWIENGDLIFPIVAVSAAHYAAVLAGRDHWLIAFIIGVLVDLGHYRLVKASIKYGGWFWLGALVMTGFAFGFHFAFYEGDDWRAWMQAAAIPAVVIFLAMLSVRERWAQRFGEASATRAADNPGHAPVNDRSMPEPARSVSNADRLADIVAQNAARNGQGAMTSADIAARYAVSERTARRDLARLAKVV